jgi:hypothetical protein
VFRNMNVTKHLFLIVFLSPMMVLAYAELPDPTRPATYIVENIEPVYFEEVDVKEKINWKLTAIRISSEDRTAIVNGKLVRVGDKIRSAIITEINQLSVIINHEDRKLIVRLFNNQVKKDYKISK